MSLPLLRTEGLCKDFKGLRALNHVSFSAEEGEITSIVGPNGAGKTTLFNLIAGVFPSTQGQVFYGEQDITSVSSEKVCPMGIARTYQSVRPFLSLSVENNVRVSMTYGRRGGKLQAKMAEKEMADVLNFVGLAEKSGAVAETLIPLDRKRLELARALATDPKLLLLDELIAGLTPTEAMEMMETIRGINKKGVTILLIEHVMKAVMGLSDKVVVLHHGEKIAEGKPETVMNDTEVVEAYLGTAL